MIATEDLFVRPVEPQAESETETAVKISTLLTQSTEDFKESRGGHVPDVLVNEVIHKVYTSLDSITNTFAETAHRFVLVSQKDDELYGTILIAKSTDIVLVKNSKCLNVPVGENSGGTPRQYHSVINFATKKEYRLNGLAKMMLKEISRNHRDLFAGKGLWIRGEPPLHDAIIGVGFQHRTEYDQFCHAGAQLPPSTSSVWDFNKKYLCSCRRAEKQMEIMKTQKYKYGIFTIDF